MILSFLFIIQLILKKFRNLKIRIIDQYAIRIIVDDDLVSI